GEDAGGDRAHAGMQRHHVQPGVPAESPRRRSRRPPESRSRADDPTELAAAPLGQSHRLPVSRARLPDGRIMRGIPVNHERTKTHKGSRRKFWFSFIFVVFVSSRWTVEIED